MFALRLLCLEAVLQSVLAPETGRVL